MAKGPLRSSRQAAACYYQSNYSKLEAIPLSTLSKDTTIELGGLSSRYPFNAEHQAGNCEYQLLKSFDLIRPRNRTQVYQLRGEHSNH